MVGNRAWEAFVAEIGSELVLAQVLILRQERGFELRHADDIAVPAEQLRQLAVPEFRALAQFTASGAFRPLKSAPNLQTGWRAVASNADELGLALQHLYPNVVADWFAARQTPPPITNYRDFTNRQTGMYRMTQLLSDAQAGAVVRACCDPKVCLKRRLWSVAQLAIDAPESKSMIPCLEPCALLLEFARTVARRQQADKAGEDRDAKQAAAFEQSLANPNVREADFNVPSNPRRLLFALENAKMQAEAIRE